IASLEKAITPRSKAIIAVHLFGQSCNMEPLLKLATVHHLIVIEDNAQSLGTTYTFADGHTEFCGTMGTIGCTSFFPTKPLGCYGDGGALFCRDADLAEKLRMLANHGQKQKYHHEVIGINSRLDAVQASVLNVKLRHLDEYKKARQLAAAFYTTKLLAFDPDQSHIITPATRHASHIYHQYTLRVLNGKRDALRQHLEQQGIPTMVYFPIPLHKQEAYLPVAQQLVPLSVSEQLCQEVLSLPMHTELTTEMQTRIVNAIKDFYE
ncbi:MAG: DegT/DnrJ/EryC1/StrS family aminotransferase, partial [Bacteroidales bacterium]|nr:DegT/DnrJ/EryC1/StrS family aminotransferase [Bacteroidales bacterium]